MKFLKNKLEFDCDESRVELKVIKSRFGDEKFVDVTLRFPAVEQARQLHEGAVWLQPRSTDLISESDTAQLIKFIISRGKDGYEGYQILLVAINQISTIDKIKNYRRANQHKYSTFAGTRWMDELTA